MRRKTWLYISGIIILLVGALFLGIPLLIRLSIWMGSLSGNQEETIVQRTFLAPPLLQSSYTATNSATITLSGSAMSGSTVELYRNESLIDSQTTKENGTFTFEEVVLEEGTNTFTAQAQTKDAQSNLSSPLIIQQLSKGPELMITAPQDGQIFTGDSSRVIVVSGTISSQASVTVNGARAILDGKGGFRATIRLNDGDNTISLVARDRAGNTTDASRRVTLQP
jgi:bacillopeptidase F